MSRFRSVDSLLRENQQLLGNLSQVEEAYGALQRELRKEKEAMAMIVESFSTLQKEQVSLRGELATMHTDYDGLRSVASSQLRFGSLAKSTYRQLRTPPPEREEKEKGPEARAKRSRGSRLEERKWRRVGSPEPSEVEERVVGSEKVGEALDPEKEEGFSLPVMVKVGGVWWGDGIGGVLAGLQGTGIVSCEGSRWLVGKEERDRRRRGGSKSSTVLLKVKGVGAAKELCRSGLWVSGYWYSVRKFVAIPPRRKDGGWVARFGLLSNKLEGLKKGLAWIEGGRKGKEVEDVEEVRLPREWRKEVERREKRDKEWAERVVDKMRSGPPEWMTDAELEELMLEGEESEKGVEEAVSLAEMKGRRKGKRAKRRR